MKKCMQVLTALVISLLLFVIVPTAFALVPSTLNAEAKGPNQINLTWSAVTDAGYGYVLEIQSDGDARYPLWTTLNPRNGQTYIPYWVTESHYKDPIDGTPCQFPVFSLKYGTTYNFRIKTYRKTDSETDLYSAYSASASATTTIPSTIRHVKAPGFGRKNGTSESDAWAAISDSRVVPPGTLVIIHGGEYDNDRLYPANSGINATTRIWFVVDPGETAVITSSDDTAILSENNNYIVVDGLTVRAACNKNQQVLSKGTKAGYWVFANCEFDGSLGGSSPTLQTYHNFVHGCYFHDFGLESNATEGDTFVMTGGNAHSNIVQFGTHRRGAHSTTLLLNGPNYNQIMCNLYDGGLGMGFNIVSNKSQPLCNHNLFEGNIVRNVQKTANYFFGKPMFQASGTQDTYRRNLFYDGNGNENKGAYPAMTFELSGVHDQNADSNLIYNNVFFHIGSYIYITDTSRSGGTGSTKNSVIANNIFYGCGNYTTDKYSDLLIFQSGTYTGSVIENNLMLYMNWSTLGNNPDAKIVYKITDGRQRSVAYANENYGDWSRNITSDPDFVDLANRDFHPKGSSPVVDKGISILDSTWGTIPFYGASPDIGAFEFSHVDIPGAPKALRIISK